MGRSVEQKLPVARCDKDGCRRWVVRMELGNPDFQPDQDVWAARWNRYNVTVNMRLNDLEKETLDKWSPSVRSGWYIGWCKRHGPEAYRWWTCTRPSTSSGKSSWLPIPRVFDLTLHSL